MGETCDLWLCFLTQEMVSHRARQSSLRSTGPKDKKRDWKGGEKMKKVGLDGCNLSTQDAEAEECLQVTSQHSKRPAKNKTNKNPGF